MSKNSYVFLIGRFKKFQLHYKVDLMPYRPTKEILNFFPKTTSISENCTFRAF